MKQDDCLFCNIATGTIPAVKVYENDDTFAFLDIEPVSEGHTLVIGKNHSTNITDISEKDFAAIMETVRKIAPAVKTAVNASGLNIGINNGVAAGQTVMHTHVHIMPRFDGDGRELWIGNGKKSPLELEPTATKIRTALS